MNGRLVFRIFWAILLVAVLVGGAVFIYNAGVSQGLATNPSAGVPEGQAPAVPYYGWHMYRPWGFGFFPFGFIFPLFFGFLFLLLIGSLLFRVGRGYGPGHRHYGWHEHGQHDIPPMVAEWHRRMHTEQSSKPEEQP